MDFGSAFRQDSNFYVWVLPLVLAEIVLYVRAPRGRSGFGSLGLAFLGLGFRV